MPKSIKLEVADEIFFEVNDILLLAVKILNGEGFLVTAYQTKKYKKKGELIWPDIKER